MKPVTNRRQKDHSELICNIGEIGGLFKDSTSLENFLQRIVEMIAEHMGTEVCSIYLYNEQSQELVLKATVGLNKELIDTVTLKMGEGLTGLALKELRPICERNASKNDNFRYFPGLGEEKFESFLAVPIIRGTFRIGAMVIQTTTRNYFREEDIQALRAITSQLANTIEMTRLILELEEKKEYRRVPVEKKNLSCVKGLVGSPGLAQGQAKLWDDDKYALRNFATSLSSKFSLADFRRSVEQSEKQLEGMQKQIEETLSDVASLIFAAQILMLKDLAFLESIENLITAGTNPAMAIAQVVEGYVQRFESLPNAFLREKAHDVLDIGWRLLTNLSGNNIRQHDVQGQIIIARELFPSDALKLSSQKAKGIVVLSGGTTSHLSILARSLDIPLIIAEEPALLTVTSSTMIAMDAFLGEIYVNPSSEVLKVFKDKEKIRNKIEQARNNLDSMTETADGTRIQLVANINLLSDLKNARDFKLEGIGLYRTEFPFIVRQDLPSEEEQFVVYSKIVDGMKGKEITFRTLDIGGDKILSYFADDFKEENPFLGLRSIRFSLTYQDIFIQQIRAILRAGVGADLRIMFPMISSLEEFLVAQQHIYQCVEQLKSQGIPCNAKPKIGLMVEMPSVVNVLEDIAPYADFFSIGTNDLIQYLLAVDRTNQKVASWYKPHHPAVLRALKKIVDTARNFDIDVSICGDMVHHTKYIPFLVGIGLRKLSLNPIYMIDIQSTLKRLHLGSAETLAERILTETKVDDIAAMLRSA